MSTDPNTIQSIIILVISTAMILFVVLINDVLTRVDIKLSNFFYKNLYYYLFKTVDFIQRVLFKFLLPALILLHPMFAEYPKKISYYICDDFIECVIPKSYTSVMDGEVIGSFQPYKIPFPFDRKRFIKLNSYILDYDSKRDMLDIEDYFKKHPYSF